MDLRMQKRDGAEAIPVVAAGQSRLAPRVTRGIIERFVAQHPADKALQKRAEHLSDASSRSSASWVRASRTPRSASACS